MADESHIKVGDNLAGFEILAKIAEGGMGAVYKARQVSLDRIVAIKILPPRLAADEQFVRHFQEESRVAAKLKHPHLIEVYDAGKIDGTHYFVMEYVEGETVGDKMRRDGPFVEHLAVGICLNVAQALQYAWEKAKLIHGDIKPENLLIERDSRKVRIGDLGLGKSLLGHTEEEATPDQRRSMGTPAYVCPEQARGDKHLDVRSDMYALGATMYHMLTGKLPFEGMNAAETLAGHLHGTLDDPRKLRPTISENTVVVLERMLAKEPDDRYPTWAALAHDLDQIHNSRPPSVPPLPPGKSTVQREVQLVATVVKKKTSPALIAVEIIVILAGLAGFYWYIHSRPKQEIIPPPIAGTNAVPPTMGEKPGGVKPTTVVSKEFAPTRFEGLRLWLGADRDVARDDANRVSTWGDRSANGVNATQNDSEAKPVWMADALNGKPAIRFDGKNDRLEFAAIPADQFTVSIVFSIASIKPWAGPLNNRVPKKPGFQIVSGDGSTPVYIPALIAWNGTEETVRQKASTYVDLPSKPMIHTWIYEGGNEAQFFQDGVQTSVVECLSNFVINAACLGRGFDFMAGDIAEVVIYDRALSGTELQELQRYLESKYSIGSPDATPTIAVPSKPPSINTTNEPPPKPTPGADQVRLAEARAKALAEAENQYSVWRTTFESILVSGEYGRALESAATALADPVFALVKEKVARDEKIAQMILDLRAAARANLVGQSYFVGSTPGTVVRLESDKFWVKMSAGEIAVKYTSLDPAKIPTFALHKNRNDGPLNLAAGLYSWYRGDKDIARVYFDAATKAGTDVAPFLPAELSASTPAPEPPSKEPVEAVKPPSPAKPGIPPDDGMNMMVNHSFERWSGKTLLDWSTSNSQARPAPDTANVVDGKHSARFDFGSNQQSMQIEQPFHALAGRRYRLQFYHRTLNFDGQLWVEFSAPGDPIPRLKQALESGTDWQLTTVELNTPTGASLMVRIRASNASGSVWFDHFDLRPY